MKEYREEKFEIQDVISDGFGKLHPAGLLYFFQETASRHCEELEVDGEKLKGLFWAVLRYRVVIERMPEVGETITVKTWPLPTTKVAFPRAAAGYDREGKLCFRLISLWVLMDKETRELVLPAKSGITVEGSFLGEELQVPPGLKVRPTDHQFIRTVTKQELDKNMHMNNTRYLDWAYSLLSEDFRKNHRLTGFTACYFSEARLYQELNLCWSLSPDGVFFADSYRRTGNPQETGDRVFSAQMEFDSIM